MLAGHLDRDFHVSDLRCLPGVDDRRQSTTSLVNSLSPFPMTVVIPIEAAQFALDSIAGRRGHDANSLDDSLPFSRAVDSFFFIMITLCAVGLFSS